MRRSVLPSQILFICLEGSFGCAGKEAHHMLVVLNAVTEPVRLRVAAIPALLADQALLDGSGLRERVSHALGTATITCTRCCVSPVPSS